MMTDAQIIRALTRGNMAITPDPSPERIQPCSVDLLLGSAFKVSTPYGMIDHVGELVMEPGRFVLGTTQETVSLPSDICAEVFGKSTLGRKGLAVHITAGLIDPGFSGEITLELYNHSSVAIQLVPGMRVCQVVFHRLDHDVDRPYGHPDLGSRYQGQAGPTEAR